MKRGGENFEARGQGGVTGYVMDPLNPNLGPAYLSPDFKKEKILNYATGEAAVWLPKNIPFFYENFEELNANSPYFGLPYYPGNYKPGHFSIYEEGEHNMNGTPVHFFYTRSLFGSELAK